LASRPVMLLGNIASIFVTIAGILQALSWTIAGATILVILSITTLAPTSRGSRTSTGHSITRKTGHSNAMEPRVVREKIQEKQAPRSHQITTRSSQTPPIRDEVARLAPQSRSDSPRLAPPKITTPKTIPTSVSPAKPIPLKSGSPKQENLKPASVPASSTVVATGKPAQPRIDPNTRTIPKGDFAKYDVDLNHRGEVTCEVTASGPVNVYLMDSDNLNSLDLGEEFWSETGEEHVQKATLHFIAPQSGKWYLIVENGDNKEVSATANIRKTSPRTPSSA
jgi:hypothetical protein